MVKTANDHRPTFAATAYGFCRVATETAALNSLIFEHHLSRIAAVAGVSGVQS